MEWKADMVRQSRPSGDQWPTAPRWKSEVRAAMKESGISNSEMGRRLGVSQPAISQMLGPNSRGSRLVPGVHRELGWPPPSSATAPDELLRRINHQWPSLSRDQREAVLRLVDLLSVAGKH